MQHSKNFTATAGNTAGNLLAALERTRLALALNPRPEMLCVSIAQQRLWHFRAGTGTAGSTVLISEYTVSTSRAAPSCVPDSLGTPTGLFQIAERIGAGSPAGTVFIGRQSQNFHWHNAPAHLREKNLITSRILWLDGLQNDLNRGAGCDTHSRFIYIHGTNQHEKLGSPNSHGCVLLSDSDIIHLFNLLADRPTFVWIE